MALIRPRRIYLYKVMRLVYLQQELFATPTFQDAVIHMLNPQHQVFSRGRVWRVSRPVVRGNFVHGRLGFIRHSSSDTALYDEERFDFRLASVDAEDGSFAHFSVGLRSQIMAFEEVPGLIPRGTFIARFEDFIRGAGQPFELQALSDEADFDRWAANVDAITRLTVTVERPNPDPVEATEATSARLDAFNADEWVTKLKSGRPGGVNTHEPEMMQKIAHALAAYGRVYAEATADGRRRVYDSRTRARIRVAELPDDVEVSAVHEALDEIVEEAEADEQAAPR